MTQTFTPGAKAQARTHNCFSMMTSVINSNMKPNISSDWSSLKSHGVCIM